MPFGERTSNDSANDSSSPMTAAFPSRSSLYTFQSTSKRQLGMELYARALIRSRSQCPNFHHSGVAHNCQKWSFWRIIVDQVTICNCHGQWPWYTRFSDQKNPIPSLYKHIIFDIIVLLQFTIFVISMARRWKIGEDPPEAILKGKNTTSERSSQQVSLASKEDNQQQDANIQSSNVMEEGNDHGHCSQPLETSAKFIWTPMRDFPNVFISSMCS
jgi:hypothetical protein